VPGIKWRFFAAPALSCRAGTFSPRRHFLAVPALFRRAGTLALRRHFFVT
jgi:hypothetical protein